MKKKIALTIFLLIIMMATNVFAATEVTMEIVEDNIAKIDLDDTAYFEKKLIDSDLENHTVTLQLKVTNNSNLIIPSGELMLVIDSSNSMDEIVEGTTTRKDLVLNSANKLVKNLLDANPTSLKIGVVTFSTGTEIDSETGFLITGTEADAQKVCDFTNNLETLTDKISSIEGTGQYTNLDSGLQLAKNQFTDENNNKYMIILTDGLPNLAVGYNDLVTYNGLTDVINQTKNTLSSLDNINVITMLTGINDEEATFRTDGTNTYTYGQVITTVFGTEETPTKGKFYKISDTEIEETITNTIYRDLLPIENSLTDITIVDYIPEYIANNFDITINDSYKEENAVISDDSRTITWAIDNLSPEESKTLQFDLVLKDEFAETIIGNILDTNEKVDIEYKDFDKTEITKTSDVTPKIKLTAVPQPEPTPEPEPEPTPQPPVDNTVAPEPIPDAGSPLFSFGIILVIGITIFFGYKSRKIK